MFVRVSLFFLARAVGGGGGVAIFGPESGFFWHDEGEEFFWGVGPPVLLMYRDRQGGSVDI